MEEGATADVNHLLQDKTRAAGLGFSWSGTTGNLITAYTEGLDWERQHGRDVESEWPPRRAIWRDGDRFYFSISSQTFVDNH